MKMNCWEFMTCGSHPGGSKVQELGVCPAATDTTYDGQNNGKNAGRFCWRIAGTICGGKRQGTFGNKIMDCVVCDFFQKVKDEEGEDFVLYQA